MNSFQIESWALRMIDCVKAGQPNEDFKVELKREWIEPKKVARRLAGHSNEARGEPILWLIGVDPKEADPKDRVVGADDKDLANWYPMVKSQFDEVAPPLTPLNIPVDGKTVVALLFETDRYPFVVKNQNGGAIQYEVPIREATGVRSAHRSDLIKLLAPLQALPDVEVLDSWINMTTEGRNPTTGNYIPNELRLQLELYIVPKSNTQLVIPFHRCNAWFEICGVTAETPFTHVRLDTSVDPRSFGARVMMPNSLTIKSTFNEVIIDGPGKVELKAVAGKSTLLEQAQKYDFQITVHLLPANANHPVVLSRIVSYSPQYLIGKDFGNF